MTFTELLPVVRQLPAFEKLRLIRILAEELDMAADIFPLQPHKVYHLPTPYHVYGVGRELMGAAEMVEELDL